jgi:DNA gyrase subunit B
MPELISKGFLYIAQPPLYKVTRAKKDSYLKDDDAKNDYLLSIAAERSRVERGKEAITGEALKELLSKVIHYEARLDKLAGRKDSRIIDALVQSAELAPETLLDKTKLDAESEKLETYLEERHPELLEQVVKIERHDDKAHSSKKLVFVTLVNGSPRETVVDTAFLSSPEYRELMSLKHALTAFGVAPYTVKIGEDTHTAATYQQVLKLALDDAQKGVAIQRYKGLGEMNPEQLWETTMDPVRRTLLQVKVEDAVETDGIFTLLMGEDVEPRREFIEKNALSVTNLDI